MPSKPSTLPLWATNGGTTVEPLLAEKQAGWVSGKKLPARWMNWKDNLTYQWIQWVDGYESTAHTWTAKQTFNDVIVNDGGTNSSAALEATGSGNRSGLLGTSGSTTGAFGSKGVGANGGAFGKHGQLGQGGTGTSVGGTGQVGTGGNITGAAAGTAGQGGQWTGGNVDGTTNALANAGKAGIFQGGNVTGDVNGRVGGIAVEATGGLGENGYAYAFHAVHGGLVLDDGVIVADNNVDPHVLGTTQIDGDETVNGILAVLGATNLTGLLTAGGGIALGTPQNIGPLLNAPYAINNNPQFWKNAFGEVGCRGAIATGGAASGTVAWVQPVGFRPIQNTIFGLPEDGAGKSAQITFFAGGNVMVNYDAGFAGVIVIDCVRFRTT